MPSPAHVTSYDVVVVGGGLIGSAIGWRLARRGLSVAVVHDQRPGTASHVAAGMLAPVTEAAFTETRLLALNLDSLARFDAFSTELEAATGRPSGLSRTPTLSVGYDTDDAARLADLGGFLRGVGLSAEPRTARECRAVEPLLAPQVRSGLLVESDWSCDNRLLWTALSAVPGVHRIEATVTELVLTGGRVGGVRARSTSEPDTEITTAQVVLAGGAWSGELTRELPFTLPIRPVKGQIIRLDPGRLPRPRVTVRAFARGTECYLVSHASGPVVLGATVEEQGYDTRPTAQGTWELLRDAKAVLPMVLEYAVTELGVGLRPGSPDNAPILGPTPVEGLAVATGHYRNGVLLTPVTADAVADLVVDGTLPEVARGFTLDRFTSDQAATDRLMSTGGASADQRGIQAG